MRYIVKAVNRFELAYCNGCNGNACAGKTSCTGKDISVSVSVK